MNKKGVLGLETSKEVMIAFLVLAVVGITIIILLTALSGTFTGNSKQSAGVGSQNSIYSNVQVLSPIDNGITNATISVYNDTFLSCDGVNDYLLIYPHSNDTLSFWLNSTAPTSWVNIVNVMGNCYINSLSLPCPATYPVYWNGTAYFFCKTDATTFWAGQIDRIEVFDGQLTQTQVNGFVVGKTC